MFDHLKMGGIIQHIKSIWLVYDIALLTLVILNIRLPSVVRFIKRGWLENPRRHERWFGFVGRLVGRIIEGNSEDFPATFDECGGYSISSSGLDRCAA